MSFAFSRAAMLTGCSKVELIDAQKEAMVSPLTTVRLSNQIPSCGADISVRKKKHITIRNPFRLLLYGSRNIYSERFLK